MPSQRCSQGIDVQRSDGCAIEAGGQQVEQGGMDSQSRAVREQQPQHLEVIDRRLHPVLVAEESLEQRWVYRPARETGRGRQDSTLVCGKGWFSEGESPLERDRHRIRARRIHRFDRASGFSCAEASVADGIRGDDERLRPICEERTDPLEIGI